jgi:hypothetical protein
MMGRYDAQGIEAMFEPGSRGCEFRLRTDDGYFPRRGLPLFATARPLALGRLNARGASLEKGWCIPSIAEDDFTDIRRSFSRNTGSRR